MVDLAIQEDFEEYIKNRLVGNEVDPNIAYDVVKGFLKEQSDYYSKVFPDEKSVPFDEMFSEISLEEWNDLCKIIEQEES